MQITTNRFKLIPLKKHHATDRYLSWLHDPEVNETLDTVGRDETIETIEKYILSYKNGDILFGIFSKDGNLHIGNMGLRLFKNSHASIHLMIGDKNFWGLGVVNECRAKLVEFVFQSLGFNKIVAGCYSINYPAQLNFIKDGWIMTGVDKKAINLEGNYIDVINFEIRND
jgi:[ribosomal protein S5]-alanine N-acetyltransferase